MEKATFEALPKPVALVVDDEPLLLMDTSDIISDAGFHVIEATTADQAFAFLKEHSSLKLLFTDVHTPGKLDGFELARNVEKLWPHICIVVTSVAVRPPTGSLPENVRFLAKPLSVELVHSTLREFCGLHKG
jgi:CheY-like chemotaxis protein